MNKESGGDADTLESGAEIDGLEGATGDQFGPESDDGRHAALPSHPAGDSGLIDTDGIGGLDLSTEVGDQLFKDVHGDSNYDYSHIMYYGHNPLQEHDQNPNHSPMKFGQRLKAARKYAGLTQIQLGERVGMDQTTISKAERGKNQSSAFCASIARACGVNSYWLETGQGKMLPDGPAEPTSGMENVTRLPIRRANEIEIVGDLSAWDSDTPLEDDEVYVPLYKEVELSAGAGSTEIRETSGRMVRFARSTLREAGVQPENAKAAQVSGNSMARVIMPGATIGIDIGTTQVFDGDIYAVDHGGMLRVKYVYRLPGGGLRLRSENSEEHPDEIFTGEEVMTQGIRIIGWVFWWSTVQRRRGAPY